MDRDVTTRKIWDQSNSIRYKGTHQRKEVGSTKCNFPPRRPSNKVHNSTDGNVIFQKPPNKFRAEVFLTDFKKEGVLNLVRIFLQLLLP